MLVFTIVKALNTNVNTANWLQQAQQSTGITNVTITQENEAYNDHQTINSGEKKHSPLLITSFSLWHTVRGRNLMLHSPCLLFSKLYCQPKVVCRGLLYFTVLKLTSTLVGQHSTARLSMILASSGSSNSTAAFHKRTEFGTCSRAREAKQLWQS